MDGHSFLIFTNFVGRQRQEVADLYAEVERKDILCTEAWFMLMAMGGQPDASKEDKQNAKDTRKTASRELEDARRAAKEAARKLAYYEDFLKQCTPSAT